MIFLFNESKLLRKFKLFDRTILVTSTGFLKATTENEHFLTRFSNLFRVASISKTILKSISFRQLSLESDFVVLAL